MNGGALIEMRLLSLHISLRASTLCLTTITESDCVQALMDLLTVRSLCISTMTRKKDKNGKANQRSKKRSIISFVDSK